MWSLCGAKTNPNSSSASDQVAYEYTQHILAELDPLLIHRTSSTLPSGAL
jgi:hypothetical protein